MLIHLAKYVKLLNFILSIETNLLPAKNVTLRFYRVQSIILSLLSRHLQLLKFYSIQGDEPEKICSVYF